MNASQEVTQRELQETKWALRATEQALLDERARTSRMEPMWAAGHAYCAAREVWLASEGVEGFGEVERSAEAMRDVHRATTPAPPLSGSGA